MAGAASAVASAFWVMPPGSGAGRARTIRQVSGPPPPSVRGAPPRPAGSRPRVAGVSRTAAPPDSFRSTVARATTGSGGGRCCRGSIQGAGRRDGIGCMDFYGKAERA
ncbi:hypothetical protein GCM10010309_63720 [Streptomyces violaceochromogenes]|nr:hypothetical protein GCM10010309_63720 [Streptomyces violaceochromogenes]